MSSQAWRYAVAAVVGAALDALFVWKFLPYSIRDQHEGLLPDWALPVLTLIAGFVLTLGKRDHWLVPVALLGGFFAAESFLIVADCWNDPTNHNLWPFEFVIIVVLTAPAFLGAAVNALLRRASKRKAASG